MKYIDEFLNYLENIKKYSDNTIINYKLDLEKYDYYLKLKNKKLDNIEYRDNLDFINYLNEEYNASSLIICLIRLRSYYNYLINDKHLKDNPFKLVNGMKKDKKLPNYFKYNEYVELINGIDISNNLGIRNKCIFEVLLCTGARVNELVNIKLKDVDLDLREIKVLGKGNKERIVYLGSYAIDSINSYLNIRNELLGKQNNDYLFLNHLGNKLTTRGVRDIIDNILLKSSSNLKITPHTFRHSFATMLLSEGCDLKSVQELLGHVSLSTTSIYTHISNEELKRQYLHSVPRNSKKY